MWLESLFSHIATLHLFEWRFPRCFSSDLILSACTYDMQHHSSSVRMTAKAQPATRCILCGLYNSRGQKSLSSGCCVALLSFLCLYWSIFHWSAKWKYEFINWLRCSVVFFICKRFKSWSLFQRVWVTTSRNGDKLSPKRVKCFHYQEPKCEKIHRAKQ